MNENNSNFGVEMSAKAFAQIADTTIRTLKYYEEIDLFHPYKVNPNNGYRYYHIIQLDQFKSIYMLQQCGLKLADIKKYMHQPSFDSKLKMISLQKDILRKQIEKTTITYNMIELQQFMMEHALKHDFKGIHQLKLPFKSYQCFDISNDNLVQIQTFGESTINGVLIDEDNHKKIFKISLTATDEGQDFIGNKFLICYFAGHPVDFSAYLPDLTATIKHQKLQVCSPLFASMIYDSKEDYNISFILVNVISNT